MNGPIINDFEFFTSLDDNIPEMQLSASLFTQGKRSEAVATFGDYVRKHFEYEKVFDAYSISPEAKPSEESFELADAALEYNLGSVGVFHKFEPGKVDWYSNHTENKYEEWTWQFSRHYQLLDVALVYAYTKDERYAERAIELIHSWMKQAIRPEENVDGHATLCWRTLECGIRLVHWAKIISLTINSPAVTDEFLVDLFKSYIEHAQRLMKRCTDANWLISEMHGLYISSLLCPFIKDSGIWCDFAKDKLLSAIRSQTLPDGTHCELTFGYQSVSCHDFANVYRIGKSFNDEFPAEFLNLIKTYMHTIIKVMAPDNTTPNLNDGYLEDVYDFIKENGAIFPNDPLISSLISGKLSENPPEYTSLLFENAGIAVMRSDWSKDAIFGIFDGGKYGKCHNHEDLIRCHQHEDKLNFLMWVGEKGVVCESMNYAYDTSKMRAYSRASVGHNTVLINGMGQNRFIKASWNEETASTIEPVEFKTDDERDVVSAIYDEGYGDRAESIAYHKRTICFEKKPHLGRPFFVIKDEIFSDSENELTLIWHYDTDSLMLTENGAYCNELTTFITGDGESNIYCGSHEPFLGWRTVSVKPPKYVPTPVLHRRSSGKNVTFYTVFVPNDESGASPIRSVCNEKYGLKVTYTDGKSVQLTV